MLCTGHMARRGDDRWSKAVTEWCLNTGTRDIGRSAARWAVEIDTVAGRTWMREVAQGHGDRHWITEAYGAMSNCG